MRTFLRQPGQTAFVVLLTLLLFSCKKSDEPTALGGDPALMATWRVSAYAVKDANGVTSDLTPLVFAQFPCLSDIRVTFNADGSITGSSTAACSSVLGDASALVGGKGNWQASGGKLTINTADGSKQEYTYQLTGTTLQLSQPTLDASGKPTGDVRQYTFTKA